MLSELTQSNGILGISPEQVLILKELQNEVA